jgi:hypothetical protein
MWPNGNYLGNHLPEDQEPQKELWLTDEPCHIERNFNAGRRSPGYFYPYDFSYWLAGLATERGPYAELHTLDRSVRLIAYSNFCKK